MLTNIKKILYPTDLSESGWPALRLASSLANDHKAKLVIVYAMEPPQPVAAGGAGAAVPPPGTDFVGREEDLEKELTKMAPTPPNVDYEYRIVHGQAAQAIVQLAEEEQVDLIVMGTHGRTGLSRLLMGSVAEHVMRHAVCPVVTVRSELPKSKQPEPQGA
jgi:universal stress protein A